MKQIAHVAANKRLLVLSALDLWSMRGNAGAPSLFRTLTELANDFCITFITANKKINQNDTIDNLNVIRFGIPWLQHMFSPNHPFSFIGKMIFPIWWLVFQLWAYRIITRAMRHTQYDALYAYEILAVPVMAWIARKRRLPLITRFQGTVLAPLLHKPLSRITHFHHYYALRTVADMIIMTNDGTQGDAVLRHLHNTSALQFFWRNGVDTLSIATPSKSAAIKKQLGIHAQDILLLAMSRLQRWKRVDRCIEAVTTLADPRVHLMIIGDGPERASLEALVHNNNANQQIHFMGSIPHDALGPYYQAADIFISCYSLSNVGNPLLEAMRMAKAIITLDNGDTAEIIRHNETGMLAPENEPTVFQALLKRLISDAQLRHRLGVAAQSFANTNFETWQQRMEHERRAIMQLITRFSENSNNRGKTRAVPQQ